MPSFFLNKRLIILLVSMIILVSLIGFSLKERKELTWPEQFVKDTTGWVQTLVSRPANYIAGFFGNVKDLQNTYVENKELRSRLDELAQLKADVQTLTEENNEFRDILDKKDSLSDYKQIQATVIGRNPDRWDELLIINKGSTDGIERDMAVITSTGLIGKVKNSRQFTSTIQLLSSTDTTNRVSAEIVGNQPDQPNHPYYGQIEGFDAEKEMLLKFREIHCNPITNSPDKQFILDILFECFKNLPTISVLVQKKMCKEESPSLHISGTWTSFFISRKIL